MYVSYSSWKWISQILTSPVDQTECQFPLASSFPVEFIVESSSPSMTSQGRVVVALSTLKTARRYCQVVAIGCVLRLQCDVFSRLTNIYALWQNDKEVDAVLRVVRRFQVEGKSFRVITPYDAQRAALEKALKDKDLPWENTCFCVDSFQGICTFRT